MVLLLFTSCCVLFTFYPQRQYTRILLNWPLLDSCVEHETLFTINESINHNQFNVHVYLPFFVAWNYSPSSHFHLFLVFRFLFSSFSEMNSHWTLQKIYFNCHKIFIKRIARQTVIHNKFNRTDRNRLSVINLFRHYILLIY